MHCAAWPQPSQSPSPSPPSPPKKCGRSGDHANFAGGCTDGPWGVQCSAAGCSTPDYLFKSPKASAFFVQQFTQISLLKITSIKKHAPPLTASPPTVGSSIITTNPLHFLLFPFHGRRGVFHAKRVCLWLCPVQFVFVKPKSGSNISLGVQSKPKTH
jgi:hypothetical protein